MPKPIDTHRQCCTTIQLFFERPTCAFVPRSGNLQVRNSQCMSSKARRREGLETSLCDSGCDPLHDVLNVLFLKLQPFILNTSQLHIQYRYADVGQCKPYFHHFHSDQLSLFVGVRSPGRFGRMEVRASADAPGTVGWNLRQNDGLDELDVLSHKG